MSRFITGGIIGGLLGFCFSSFAIPPAWPAIAIGGIIGGIFFILPPIHYLDILEAIVHWFLRR